MMIDDSGGKRKEQESAEAISGLKSDKIGSYGLMDVIPGENAYINAVLDYKHD